MDADFAGRHSPMEAHYANMNAFTQVQLQLQLQLCHFGYFRRFY